MPDGYTFCILLSDILAIHLQLYKNLPYDVTRDFAPVISLVNVDAIVAAGGKSPANVGQSCSPDLKSQTVREPLYLGRRRK